jgi:hypothetical protein
MRTINVPSPAAVWYKQAWHNKKIEDISQPDAEWSYSVLVVSGCVP